ncbi:hypothetical protein BO78DRAFT_359829 [Aspergillus sclerotiicarbonarius CBS 121057]|uniref:Protein kinase domain-containing protein n=1 Tax=Aspergillus sclerotiicarbonarius (strain CBS 121057 / IBT 28362) TaxID=1448318 RepID=A0A319EK68_ASPSB|nr:hypothetical protein BO78DRAFT_359829 [Aspergillus sclerotiicarbonarius CBS 121057]
MARIELSDISFIDQIRRSDVSSIFHTMWTGKECILKVYHATQPSPADPPNREIDPFKCESAAFARLCERGLCDQGYVPPFYGFVEQINPVDASPHLKDFLEGRSRPNAILLEYIPNLRPITLSNFSEKRAHKLYQILQAIHRAGIYHGDPYPRNMMVQEDTDRVLWIDFDRAQAFTPESLQRYQVKWLEEEADMMDYFVKALTADARDGGIYRTWACYYEGYKPSWEPDDEEYFKKVLEV